jgi:glycosyltransferase involved in cell wall biosynthesis
MRVALLGPYPVQLDPSRDGPPLAGGVDAVVLALARGLTRCPGVEPFVVTAVPGLEQRRVYEENDYVVHAVPRPRGGRLTGQRAVVSNLLAEIQRIRPDITHAHIAGVHARAALESPFPSVITLHGIIRREMRQAWPITPWRIRIGWYMDARAEERIVREAPEIIAISPYVLNEFSGRAQARFHTVENPVDDRFFTREPLPSAQRLLCVARVIARKGVAALIRSFALIAAALPAARLDVIGEMDAEPAYAAGCRDLVATLGLTDRVRFLGPLPPDTVAHHYATCNLFVLASEQETAPVSIAEAMAAGRPVLATDVGGCGAMVVDGVGGRITPPRDVEALARAGIDMLSDPAALVHMGEAARAAAEARFRLDVVVGQTLGVYEQVRAAYESRTTPTDADGRATS